MLHICIFGNTVKKITPEYMHLHIAYKVVAFISGYVLRFEADLKNYTTDPPQESGKFCVLALYFPILFLVETNRPLSNLK